MTRHAAYGLLAALLLCSPAWAQDRTTVSDAMIAAQAARVETLRARVGTVSSPTASATLIEADNLLRQLRAAPPSKRAAIAAQLDAALTRGDLEVDAIGRSQY
jgi:hypothetical protein